MKLRTSMLVLILASIAKANQQLDIFVNNNSNIPLTVLGPAEAFATRILASADVTVTWRMTVSSILKDSNRIFVLDLQANAPGDGSKGALGYALLSQGSHASIFYDRIRRVATDNQQPYVLAHAMAHEIAHLLQRDGHHSATGVMKAHWSQRDILDMRHLLVFTPEDIRMIRNVKESSHLSGGELY